MFRVLGYVIRLGNHVAALVDEKGVGREVPNEEQIFCNRSEHIMLKERQDNSLANRRRCTGGKIFLSCSVLFYRQRLHITLLNEYM